MDDSNDDQYQTILKGGSQRALNDNPVHKEREHPMKYIGNISVRVEGCLRVSDRFPSFNEFAIYNSHDLRIMFSRKPKDPISFVCHSYSRRR